MKSALDVHRALLARRRAARGRAAARRRVLTADDLPRVLQLETGCVAVRCYEVERDDGPAFAAVLVPADRTPSPTALLEALDARSVRPARPDAVNARTDYAAGLVSPVCLPDDVELLADSALGSSDVCWTALGEGGVALGIRTRDLLVVTGARVAALSSPGAGEEVERAVACCDLDRAARTPGQPVPAGSVRPPDAPARSGQPGRRDVLWTSADSACPEARERARGPAPDAPGGRDERRRTGPGPARPGRARCPDRPARPAWPAAVVAAEGPRRGRRDRGRDRRARGRRGDRHRPARVVGKLGTIDFWFVADGRRVHKTVHHYLLLAADPVHGLELSDADVEVSEVAWVPLDELSARLAYADERRLLDRVPDLLAETA